MGTFVGKVAVPDSSHLGGIHCASREAIFPAPGPHCLMCAYGPARSFLGPRSRWFRHQFRRPNGEVVRDPAAARTPAPRSRRFRTALLLRRSARILLSPMACAIPAIPMELFPPENFPSDLGESNRVSEAMPPRSDNGSQVQVPMGRIKDRILSVSQHPKVRISPFCKKIYVHERPVWSQEISKKIHAICVVAGSSPALPAIVT